MAGPGQPLTTEDDLEMLLWASHLANPRSTLEMSDTEGVHLVLTQHRDRPLIIDARQPGSNLGVRFMADGEPVGSVSLEVYGTPAPQDVSYFHR